MNKTPTVTTRRSNQIRNLGKERSAEMHAKAVDKIDKVLTKATDIATARAERRAVKRDSIR